MTEPFLFIFYKDATLRIRPDIRSTYTGELALPVTCTTTGLLFGSYKPWLNEITYVNPWSSVFIEPRVLVIRSMYLCAESRRKCNCDLDSAWNVKRASTKTSK